MVWTLRCLMIQLYSNRRSSLRLREFQSSQVLQLQAASVNVSGVYKPETLS